MSAALNTAVRWNVLDHNPCGPIKPPRETEASNRVWDTTIIKSLLLDALDGAHGVAIWTLGYSGMRRAEA